MKIAALLALLLLAPLVHALDSADAVNLQSRVGTNHPDFGKALIVANVKLGYVDANTNNAIDTDPDEPVYLDIDGNGRVSYGDLRLTPYTTYSAGSMVDLGNRDYNLPLSTPSGWFAGRGGVVLAFDSDFSGTINAGDVRLNGTKVRAGDADSGQKLDMVQGSASPTQRTGYVDHNGNGRRDPSEPVFLDMDHGTQNGGGRVSEGDIVFLPGPFATDDWVSRAELEALKATPAGEPGSLTPSPSKLGSFEWLLVALAVLNLAGLIYVVRELRKPRHPFR